MFIVMNVMRIWFLSKIFLYNSWLIFYFFIIILVGNFMIFVSKNVYYVLELKGLDIIKLIVRIKLCY